MPSLAALLPRLRPLVPAPLYARVCAESSPATLLQVFEHLRTLLGIVSTHVPRDIADVLPRPGGVQHTWHEGTLMCTDLAGFTRLVALYSLQGREGAGSTAGHSQRLLHDHDRDHQSGRRQRAQICR